MTDKIQRCNKCNRKKEFWYPENLCEEHFAKWWVDTIFCFVPLSDQQYEKEFQKTLKVVHERISQK